MSQTTVQALALIDFKDLTESNVYKACGWYDWFCSEKSLVRRSKPMISLAKRIIHKWGETGIFLKNNCPCVGSTYDSFVLQNSNGDNHFWIENRDGWTVIDVPNNCKEVFSGTLVQVAKFLNEQDLPN